MAERQPTQEQRINAARYRASVDPDFAAQVLAAIYNRNTATERRNRRHAPTHDRKGYAEEDMAVLCHLHERLERDGWRWHQGNVDAREMVFKYGRKYAAQYVKWQDQLKRERDDLIAYTADLLDGEAAEDADSGARIATEQHGSGSAEHPSDALAYVTGGNVAPVLPMGQVNQHVARREEERKAARREQQMEEYNARMREEDPMWGAAASNLDALDRMVD